MTLTEEQRGTVGFDLEKARAALEEAIDRMSLTVSDEDGFIWEADPEQTAILQEMLDRIGRYTNNDYLDIQYQLDSADTEIERLRVFESAARDLNNDLTRIAGERDELAAHIQELEDAHKRSGKKYAKIINELRSSVYANIPGLDVGKIGPGARPPCWQITEERKAALAAMSSLRTDVDCPQCDAWLHFSDIAEHAPVLRAMLREAE